MSLQTWKQEFFPIEPSKRMTKKQAINHSILKWTGLTKGNLKKHGVVQNGNEIRYGWDWMDITSGSCALCVKYLDGEWVDQLGACKRCPLAQHLGHPCEGVGSNRPYSKWLDTGNANPMIKALKALLEEK